MAASKFKSSINVKTLGQPRNVLAEMAKEAGADEAPAGKKQLLGTIIGSANGVVKRSDPKDPDRVYYGLSGKFEAIPANPESDAVGGSNLFAPDSIHNEIVAQLTKGGKGTIVSFAFEAYVVAGGTAGFTWEYAFLSDGAPDQDDVLAEVRKLVGAKKEEPAKLEAPAKKSKAA